jgi:hypothetical protein
MDAKPRLGRGTLASLSHDCQLESWRLFYPF